MQGRTPSPEPLPFDHGEGGIRTPDKAFRPYNGLANRRLQPLGHLSTLWPNNLAARRFLWKGGDRHAVHRHPGRPMSVYESAHPLTYESAHPLTKDGSYASCQSRRYDG